MELRNCLIWLRTVGIVYIYIYIYINIYMYIYIYIYIYILYGTLHFALILLIFMSHQCVSHSESTCKYATHMKENGLIINDTLQKE